MVLIVVPAKPLARAKARLAPILDAEERRMLCLAMLADVCAAAVAVKAGAVMVVTSDTDAEAVACAVGAGVIRDPTPTAGLNASLTSVIPATVGGVLVVSSDVAACSPDDLSAMVGFEGVRLAPDAEGRGTNALWRQPPDAIPLAFGEQSFDRHTALAAERSVPLEVVRRPGLALDIDLPAHLKDAWDSPLGANTRSALADLGFPNRGL